MICEECGETMIFNYKKRAWICLSCGNEFGRKEMEDFEEQQNLFWEENRL